jgi:AcrR family transcriptional regulator
VEASVTSPTRAGRRPSNPRGQGDRLRKEIVTVATELVAESGDAGALTLRGVARRLGIAAPSIYRHFADVDELKLAISERAFADFAAARDAATKDVSDPAAALLGRCQVYCQFALDHPGPYRFLFRPQPARPGVDAPLPGGPAIAGLRASIQACQAEGLAAAGDPDLLATQVWAALHGLVLLRMNVPHFPWPAPLPDMVQHTVTRLLGLPVGTSSTRTEHDHD